MKTLALLLTLCSSMAWAAGPQPFTALFNGRDLTGWVNVNCAPETWTVRDGMIHCTGKPTGALRTTRPYENFIFELEWRHLTSGGNSGIFIWSSPIAAPGVPFLRAIEVQVLDHGYDASGKNEWYTTHGDVFPIHGSSMKPFGRHNGMRSFPSEERSHPSPEWNQYRIVCTNGVLQLSVNGKEVSGGAECNFRKGYIGLESEGAPVDFRNLRLQELPSSGAGPEVSAPLDAGWRPLFSGLDFRGWKTNEATAARWTVRDEKISLTPGEKSAEAALWSEQAFGNVQIVLDCRVKKGADGAAPVLLLQAGGGAPLELPLAGLSADKYARFEVTLKENEAVLVRDGTEIQRLPRGSSQGKLGLSAEKGSMDLMNLYVRDL